ncbi:IS630 family transposase [Halorientalis pallida]|uniref:IS630 family transposase n=1 Tax=Halorientalis pallida TaxID=2479928 RepID=A0A498KR29_9EURY|nr:IS630 family transposase [Halorientalis pallida]RXK46159.1 IS630 family transposase [Halorientalis pallida]
MASLNDVSTEDLRQVLAEVEGKKPTQRVMATINYLEEDEATLEDVAERYGYAAGWLSRWLDRLERLADEPFEEVVYDEHHSGRPSELFDQQHDKFVEALHESPEEVGYDAPAWSVPLARHYLAEEFDVEYCERHVRRLMSEAGLSWKTTRPEFDKSDERAQEAWQDGFKKRDNLDDEYTILTIDQTRQVLSTLIYAWFPEGERPSLPVTGAWDSIKLLGAVSDAGETFFLPCTENFNSDTTIRLLDALQTEFGEKICVVLDNAWYFTANAVQEFVEDTLIELCYLPRGSPELNPAEECWRQLDQELGNRLFDTLDDLRDAALSGLNRIEVPDVFTYLCP